MKALVDDPALRDRARAVLLAAGIDPANVKADVPLSRPRLLSLATFRRTVNPLFYQAGDDTYACARCHANHTILRIAEAEPGRGLNGEQLMINYNSALKVVNLGQPEQSLLLRKPLSPQGQGGVDPSSPTGLTHVGGPRWRAPSTPPTRRFSPGFARQASRRGTRQAAVSLSADSHAPGYEPGLAGDGDVSTLWHTEFVGGMPGVSARPDDRPGLAPEGRRLALRSPTGFVRTAASAITKSACRSTARPGASRWPKGAGPTIRLTSSSPCPVPSPASSASAV